VPAVLIKRALASSAGCTAAKGEPGSGGPGCGGALLQVQRHRVQLGQGCLVGGGEGGLVQICRARRSVQQIGAQAQSVEQGGKQRSELRGGGSGFGELRRQPGAYIELELPRFMILRLA